MTITLGDVEKLLGIRADGFPVVDEDSSIDYISLCHELLGTLPPDEEIKSKTDVSVRWFRSEFGEPLMEEATDVEIAHRARAVILYFINSRLFADHSKGRFSLKFLPFLSDFRQCGYYSWGSAILSYLYRELSNVALQKSNSLGGCMTLLQVIHLICKFMIF